MTVDPAAARFLRMLGGGAKMQVGLPTLQARRESLRQLTQFTADPAIAGVVAEPLVIDRSAGASALRLRLYREAALDADAQGVIIYLHGGGWVAGDLDTHDGVCRALASHSGCKVLAVDYRRPPEDRFPAAVHDAAEVVAWSRLNAERLGVDPARVALAGDSAGGNLATAAAGLLHGNGGAPIALLVLLCPILELAPIHPSRTLFAEGFFLDQTQLTRDLADYLTQPADALSPLASPLRIAGLEGFPTTHLHLAEYDPFRDEGLAFAARLQAAGVDVRCTVYPGMIHYFYALPRAIPRARDILADIGQAIGDHLRRV